MKYLNKKIVIMLVIISIYSYAFTFNFEKKCLSINLGVNLGYLINDEKSAVTGNNDFGEAIYEKEKTNPKGNLNFGLNYQHKISPKVSLSSNMEFLSISSILKLSSLKTKYQSDFVNVGLLANYHLSDRVALGFGPSLTVPLNKTKITPVNYEGGSKSIDKMKLMTPSFKANINYDFYQAYGLELSYMHNFSSIVKEDFFFNKIYVRAISLNLTYKI
ncbi:MAG: outer membrane beta-barrel protein [Candidatus Cloacimonadales bacterium]